MKTKRHCYLIQKFHTILINEDIYIKELNKLMYKNNLDIIFDKYIFNLYVKNKEPKTFIFEYFIDYLCENKFYKNLFKLFSFKSNNKLII